MESKNIISLRFAERREQDGERILKYVIEYEGDRTKIVSINLPLSGRPVKTDEISFESTFINKSFVNGFKVVKTKNGEYGYIREEDNCLLPYRFDVALDFNEHGLAMVGKHGYVTWINKNFEYLDSRGQMTMEQEGFPFRAWDKINAFSKGENPLSLVVKRFYDIYTYCYMDTFGKFKSFVEVGYNKELKINSLPLTAFPTGTSFNEQGYATSENLILSSKGYMVDWKDLLKMCADNGYLDLLFDAIDKKVQDQGRTLKR